MLTRRFAVLCLLPTVCAAPAAGPPVSSGLERFTFAERYKITLCAEMFNVLNVANLSGYNFNLDSAAPAGRPQTYSFGQPTQRIAQVFGSGGPRAVQVLARFTF